MASIENRSRFKVAVQNRDDLTLTFAHSAVAAVKAYIEELKANGFKPKVSRLNDSFAVRVRQVTPPSTHGRRGMARDPGHRRFEGPSMAPHWPVGGGPCLH